MYSQLKSFSNFEFAVMIEGLASEPALVDISNEYEEAMNNRSLLGLIAACLPLALMEVGDGVVAPQEQPTPDHRTDATQNHLELVNA